MPNVMAALPNIGGTLCSTQQSLAERPLPQCRALTLPRRETVEISWAPNSPANESQPLGPKFTILLRHMGEILLFMAGLCNRAGHYIFALWFLSSFMVALCNRETIYIFMLFLLLSSFLFPRLISAVGDWMSAILPHMVWP